jgi:hypothetical protein
MAEKKEKTKKKHNLDEYIHESLANIRHDRAMADSLLIDLYTYIKQDNTRHQNLGMIAAKYLETLQRSNEQMVKISSLLHKEKSSAPQGLTAIDKEEIFDLLKEG